MGRYDHMSVLQSVFNCSRLNIKSVARDAICQNECAKIQCTFTETY